MVTAEGGHTDIAFELLKGKANINATDDVCERLGMSEHLHYLLHHCAFVAWSNGVDVVGFREGFQRYRRRAGKSQSQHPPRNRSTCEMRGARALALSLIYHCVFTD